MKRYIKSTGYKSGDRYYGGLSAEPSAVEYGQMANSARDRFNKFMSDNNVTVINLDQYAGPVAKFQSYIWKTPDNREIEIIYFNRGAFGGSVIDEAYVDGPDGYHKVDVYNSKYNLKSLREAYLPDVISAFNSNNDKLSLVFYN